MRLSIYVVWFKLACYFRGHPSGAPYFIGVAPMCQRVDFVAQKHSKIVSSFDCGSDPWATEVSAWIKAPISINESAAFQMKADKKFRVWLFLSDDQQLVGFTSLHYAIWEHGVEEASKHIQYIPYFGINLPFQGKKCDSHNKKYAKILFDDLIAEARKSWNLHRYLIGLHVAKGNTKATEFYEKCYNFKVIGEEDGYYRMVADLGDD